MSGLRAVYKKPPSVDGDIVSFCFGLALLHDLLANFTDGFLWQKFFAVTGIVSTTCFVLLDKTNCACGAKFTKQGFKTDGVNMLKGHCSLLHREASIA